MEAAFQRCWAAKEAFIKARGDGVGFGALDRVELVEEGFEEGSSPGDKPGRLLVDGVCVDEAWSVRLTALPRRHFAAVALAAPREAVDAWGVRAPVCVYRAREGGLSL
jgi:phosphopantetheinyl transferase